MDENTCPRCGGGIPNDAQRGAYIGALSRWDNVTYICSACGQDEAMLQFGAEQSREARLEVLDPISGAVPWRFPQGDHAKRVTS